MRLKVTWLVHSQLGLRLPLVLCFHCHVGAMAFPLTILLRGAAEMTISLGQIDNEHLPALHPFQHLFSVML